MTIAFVMAAGAVGQADESPKPPLSPRAQAIVAKIEAMVPGLMERTHVPGVSVALIEGRRVVWDKQWGVRQAGRPEKVDRNTVFEACSMSKPVFAYLVLQVVEQGKLDLDRPLVEYLDKPYLPDEPRHKKITGRMCLTHTTGFPNWREGGWRKGGPLPVLFEPGTKFGYSGEGMFYLQRVVEHITGEPLEKLARRQLFEPTGMTSSSYVWEDRYAKQAAAGHDNEGRVKTDQPRFHRANAGYSLFCTPTDYARYLCEIMKKDRSAPHSLNAAMVTAMLARGPKDTGHRPIDRPGVAKSRTLYRGLGWGIDPLPDGDRILHSGTNGTGFRCHSEFDPKRGTGIVIMTNGLRGDEVWQAILKAISDPK
ncbi:MAG: beta-lactamase family protein [Pirellulales bacterium]|nr:beta-lactamase family protein [Pirellulales bacterium]